jgi:ABC-type sugar transport system permease subunit
MQMETIQPPDDVPIQKSHSTGRIALGVLLLLPSLVGCISQLLLPTINTFLMSFQKIELVGSERTYVGLDNYARLLGDESFWRAAGFTLTTLLLRLFVVALVPLLLAWAASQFGRPLRLGLRILLTLPIFLFVPVAIAVTWLMFLNPASGSSLFERSWAASPSSARSTLLFIDALYLFGLASGLGLMIYLPLWRRPVDVPRPSLREVLKPMLATWVLGILGIIVLTLSTFTLNYVLTSGGPAGSTSTLGIYFYQSAFRNLNMGTAASVASLILLVTLILGILAGLLVIMTRLRLDIVDAKPVLEKAGQAMAPRRSHVLPGIVLAILVLFTLGACLFSALPFGWLIPQAFGKDGLGSLMEQISAGQVFNSLVTPLVTATLQVIIAYLAALGIGALQPLGKRSKWVLLLFSPWLFVTVLPLSLVNFLAVQKAGLLDTLRGSLSPILFSVPALFILTIFFSGRASQLPPETTEGESWVAPNFFRHFILPSLPLAAVLWLVILFLCGQDVLWPLLVSVSPERYTLSVTLLRLVATFGGVDAAPAAAVAFFILPVCLFFFICLIPFQIFYLDRLALYAESPSNLPDKINS